jgi:excisionase family DNA binding protein
MPENNNNTHEEKPMNALSVHGVADYLNISACKVYQLVWSNELPHFYVGKIIRILRSDVDGWIAKQKQ